MGLDGVNFSPTQTRKKLRNYQNALIFPFKAFLGPHFYNQFTCFPLLFLSEMIVILLNVRYLKKYLRNIWVGNFGSEEHWPLFAGLLRHSSNYYFIADKFYLELFSQGQGSLQPWLIPLLISDAMMALITFIIWFQPSGVFFLSVKVASSSVLSFSTALSAVKCHF